MTIKNARGKGAGHVIDFAARQRHSAAYDVVAALLDTDTDWSDATRRRAKQASVHVLACEPCLEAMLLAAKRQRVEGMTTEQLKRQFEQHFGRPAANLAWERALTRNIVDQWLPDVGVLDNLVSLLLNARLRD